MRTLSVESGPMLFPISCYTCHAPIGHLWPIYREEHAAGKDVKALLQSLGIDRFCCRKHFITYDERLVDTVVTKSMDEEETTPGVETGSGGNNVRSVSIQDLCVK